MGRTLKDSFYSKQSDSSLNLNPPIYFFEI